MRRSEAGVTLIEVVIAVTLLSLLTLGMAMAMRVGLSAYSRTEKKLMDIRRVSGAQRILQSELNGLIPAFALCGMGGGSAAIGARAVAFQGEPSNMWLVTAFSLQQGWRGQPQLVQLFVVPGEESGVRLLVNELPYTGTRGAGQRCVGTANVPGSLSKLAQFAPLGMGPKSFVLADKLAYCRFSYYTPPPHLVIAPSSWEPTWHGSGWPLAVRIDMAPLTPDPSTLQPITVTAPLHIRRDPEKTYEDDY